MSQESQEEPRGDRQDEGAKPTDLRGLRGGGLKLRALKLWRVRGGLTQEELAVKVDMPLNYVQRVEQGRRGCNPTVARKMADVLGVDLRELRAEPDREDLVAAAAEAGRPGARPDPGEDSPFLRLGSPRYLHNAYLKVLLEREFGSSYLTLEEGELGRRLKALPVEEAVEVIARRRRELGFVEGLLAPGEGLHPQVRLFLEEIVRERPAEDIRVLAARRAREPSEGGRERLTRAMRGFCEAPSCLGFPAWERGGDSPLRRSWSSRAYRSMPSRV